MLLEKHLVKKIVAKSKQLDDGKMKIQLIESGGTGLGIPDIFIRTLNNDVWIEAKRIVWPKRDNTEITIPFQPGQFGWIREYIKLDGKCFLAVIVNGGSYNKKIFMFYKYDIHKTYNLGSFYTLADLILEYNNFDIQQFYTTLDRCRR